MGDYPTGRDIGVRVAGVGVAALLFSAVAAAGDGRAAYSFRSPFNPEECGRAIAAAHVELARRPSDSAARQLLGEGQLCEGLQDDPGALDAAIQTLDAVAAAAPSDFFAQLDLADALRKRFPLSNETEAAMRKVRALAHTADLGAARGEILHYVRDNLAAVEEERARTLPVLEGWEAVGSDAQGALSSRLLVELVGVLALTGPDGLARAGRMLEAYLHRHPGDGIATLYRAEVLRGRIDVSATRSLYQEAIKQLCPGEAARSDSRAACLLARWRIRQLAAAAGGVGRLAHTGSESSNSN
jgi:hypothetical protein